jgi:hypothetical protein
MNTIRFQIIPQDNLAQGIISYYKYIGPPTESVLCQKNILNIPKINHSEYGVIPVALTCQFSSQYLIIEQKLKPIYMVPIFFTKRVRRRSTAIIKHYNLKKLYMENPSLIGYYEIEHKKYSNLTQIQITNIMYHNKNLFKMALKYNIYAKTLCILSNTLESMFFKIPIDVMYIIIKLVLS